MGFARVMVSTSLRAVLAWLCAAWFPIDAAAGQPLLLHDHEQGIAFSMDGKTLLVPSHEGLAAYVDGAWWEAGGPAQGFSGFAVTARAIYSSGHLRPGAAQSEPAGLMRSTDGGRSWQPLALRGQADFHLLAAGYRSNAIYVLNTRSNPAMPAQGLYATHDEGSTWRRAAARGFSGHIHGLAAHPTERDTLAVASNRGLYVSRDGGESFRLVDRRQIVTALAFDAGGARVRVARALSNEIADMTLDGTHQRVLRLPPMPGDYVTALALSPTRRDTLAFATRRGEIRVSADGGRTWRQIAPEQEEQAEPR